MNDGGEQDDKLIAVPTNSTLYKIKDLEDLNNSYIGITDILQLWFTNYKWPNQITSNGLGSRIDAINILSNAIKEYKKYK